MTEGEVDGEREGGGDCVPFTLPVKVEDCEGTGVCVPFTLPVKVPPSPMFGVVVP